MFTPIATYWNPSFGEEMVSERAPVCDMTKEAASAYAVKAYGENAAVLNQETNEIESVV